MNKEAEIHKMLSYLSLIENSPISLKRHNVFIIINSLLGLTLSDNKTFYNLTIDFNQNKFEVFSYNDPYDDGHLRNCSNTDIGWGMLPTIFNALKKMTLASFEQEVIDAETKKISAERQKLINAKFESLIKS